jgi:hypothetical protein
MKDTGERAAFMDYWTELFLSAAPALLAEKKTTADIVHEMKRDMQRIKIDLKSVFVYMGMQLKAIK